MIPRDALWPMRPRDALWLMRRVLHDIEETQINKPPKSLDEADLLWILRTIPTKYISRLMHFFFLNAPIWNLNIMVSWAIIPSLFVGKEHENKAVCDVLPFVINNEK